MVSLAVPKKPRVRLPHADSVAEVVEQKAVEATHRRATRIAQAKDGNLTVASVQALLDSAMKQYLPDLPRVIVTQKPFGLFRKRVLAASLDVAKLIEFSIREWPTLASQNRVAYMRNPDKASKGTPLPAAPTFSTFAYRLPYFIAAFANNRATPLSSAEDPKDKEIERLKRQLAQAKQDASSQAKTALRLRRKPPDSSSPASSPQIRRASASSLDDDWVPPSWDDAGGDHGRK